MTKPLSIEQWAEREGLDKRRAYRWVKKGNIPSVERISARGVHPDVTKEDYRFAATSSG